MIHTRELQRLPVIIGFLSLQVCSDSCMFSETRGSWGQPYGLSLTSFGISAYGRQKQLPNCTTLMLRQRPPGVRNEPARMLSRPVCKTCKPSWLTCIFPQQRFQIAREVVLPRVEWALKALGGQVRFIHYPARQRCCEMDFPPTATARNVCFGSSGLRRA